MSSGDAAERPFRILPNVTDENAHFWRGGATGTLSFLRCDACSTYVHPPSPICPECLGKQLAPHAVSGRATLTTYTVNHQPWIPGFEPPYIVAIVELEEQRGLRLTTNLVHCEEADVRIGMPLQVTFYAAGDGIFFPLFAPRDSAKQEAE